MNMTELEALVVEQGRRLAIAESDIAALNAKLGIRKVTPIEVNRAVEPDGPQITYVIERAKIALPTDEELRKLSDVVFGAFPTLRPWSPDSRFASQDEQGFMRQFTAAFTYVAHQGRAEEIDTKRSVGWWADAAGEWWRLRKRSSNIGDAAMLVAVIAAGDVPFQRGDEFGNVWAFALATWGGRPATEAWRNVLRGELRRPIPGIHKPQARFSVRTG
jgi:hypothetical protein